MDWATKRLWDDSRRRRRSPVGMSMTFSEPSRLSLVVSRHSHAQQLQPPPRFPSHSPTSFENRASVLAYEHPHDSNEKKLLVLVYHFLPPLDTSQFGRHALVYDQPVVVVPWCRFYRSLLLAVCSFATETNKSLLDERSITHLLPVLSVWTGVHFHALARYLAYNCEQSDHERFY